MAADGPIFNRRMSVSRSAHLVHFNSAFYMEALHPEVRRARLVRRCYTRQGHLHGDCFYAGLCEPIDETERRIRMTVDYIDDAERLATA